LFDLYEQSMARSDAVTSLVEAYNMTVEDINDMSRARETFGRLLHEKRVQAGLNQRGLARLAQTLSPIICSIEAGDRSVGADVAMRLADGLNLTGDERDQFLFKAAGTRKKDRLVGYSRMLLPELLNYVPKALRQAGISLEGIKAASLQGLDTNDRNPSERLVLELKDGRTIAISLIVQAEG
jgi:transcriptional regulator with XRE-family HTH domain